MMDELTSAYEEISSLEGTVIELENDIDGLKSRLEKCLQENTELENQMDRLRLQLELKDAIIARHDRILANAKHWIGLGEFAIRTGDYRSLAIAEMMERFIKGEHDLT